MAESACAARGRHARRQKPRCGEQCDQYSAAVAAIREMGVLSGHRIERKGIGAPRELDALGDDELERALIERFNALSLTPDAGGDRRHAVGR